MRAPVCRDLERAHSPQPPLRGSWPPPPSRPCPFPSPPPPSSADSRRPAQVAPPRTLAARRVAATQPAAVDGTAATPPLLRCHRVSPPGQAPAGSALSTAPRLPSLSLSGESCVRRDRGGVAGPQVGGALLWGTPLREMEKARFRSLAYATLPSAPMAGWR